MNKENWQYLKYIKNSNDWFKVCTKKHKQIIWKTADVFKNSFLESLKDNYNQNSFKFTCFFLYLKCISIF